MNHYGVSGAKALACTNGFTNEKSAYRHYKKHVLEMKEFAVSSVPEYVALADVLFCDEAGGNMKECKRGSDNAVLRYNVTTDEYGVLSPTRHIMSFYRLDPAVHGFRTNMDYFKDQCSS